MGLNNTLSSLNRIHKIYNLMDTGCNVRLCPKYQIIKIERFA